MNYRSIFPIFLIFVLTGCRPEDAGREIAIVGATAIDAQGVTEHSVVIVKGVRVAAFGTMASTPIPAGAEKVEGRGKFIIPAFVREGSEPKDALAEYERMVASGSDPRAALLALTAAPAERQKLDEFGSLAVGKRASLVLLAANPLEDPGNARRIDRVMINGVWMEKHDPYAN